MKKYVISSSNKSNRYLDDLKKDLESLDYDVKISDSFDITLSPRYEYMPEIDVIKTVYENNYYYDAEFEFPSVSTKDVDKPIDIASYVSNWSHIVSNIIDILCNFKFKL